MKASVTGILVLFFMVTWSSPQGYTEETVLGIYDTGLEESEFTVQSLRKMGR